MVVIKSVTSGKNCPWSRVTQICLPIWYLLCLVCTFSIEIFDSQGISAIHSCQFSKDFPLPKNDGHFEISPKMKKTQIGFYLLNRAR